MTHIRRGGVSVAEARIDRGDAVTLYERGCAPGTAAEPDETVSEDWRIGLWEPALPAAAPSEIGLGAARIALEGPWRGEATAGGAVRLGDPATLIDPASCWPALSAFWRERVGPKGWYRADPAIDGALGRRFGDALAAAALGRCAPWLAAPESAFALVVLLDQLPRNLFRGQAEAFAFDPLAREAAERALAAGHDLAVPSPERQFFYLPFEHSECLADQDRAVRLIRERMPDARETLRHAELHRELIKRFGRFPHRNAVLGRESTSEERRFLAEGGYRPGAAPAR